MELYEEEVNEKKSKIPMIIGICIAVLIVITILIIVGIIYLRGTVTTIKINGKTTNGIEQILYIEQMGSSSKIYVPIRKIAKFLNYEDYSGDFKNKSEDSTKCYVKNEDETAMFILDSDILIKTRENSEYENIEIDEKVFEKDGELYTTIEGVEKAFNVSFECSEDKKKINIYTMDYLLQYYVTGLNIEQYSEEFTDRKAVIENMLIIMKDNQYGVIDLLNGEMLLEAKYEEIKYLPITSEFLVKSNGKYGIISKNKSIKVRNVYDEIKMIDGTKVLYLVKQNNLYGVIDKNGKIIINPEYKAIGIDAGKYTQNGVENQYILLDEIIPIKNNEGLWGFFNTKGEKVREFEFTEIGCTTIETSNAYPAVVIPGYKIVVVQKDKKYNIMSVEGEDLIPDYILDSVCIKNNSETGKSEFYMTYNNNTSIRSIEEYLTSIGR